MGCDNTAFHITLFLWVLDILDLGEQDCTYVTFEIQQMTDKGQRSRSVNVTRDSFSVACDWILEQPRTFELSTKKSSLMMNNIQKSCQPVLFLSLSV